MFHRKRANLHILSRRLLEMQFCVKFYPVMYVALYRWLHKQNKVKKTQQNVLVSDWLAEQLPLHNFRQQIYIRGSDLTLLFDGWLKKGTMDFMMIVFLKF